MVPRPATFSRPQASRKILTRAGTGLLSRSETALFVMLSRLAVISVSELLPAGLKLKTEKLGGGLISDSFPSKLIQLRQSVILCLSGRHLEHIGGALGRRSYASA